MKTLSLLLIIIFCSCSTFKTGYYTIKEVRGLNTVTFKEVKGDYHVPVDTLRIGSKIFIKRTTNRNLANVW